jgi:hypothetical protein
MSVDLKRALVLCCGLLVVFLLATRLWRSRFEKPLDTRGWQLTEFLAHLQKRGLHLHVVPTRKGGNLDDSVYLTEDPNATWLSLHRKTRVVESIHEWNGMVWVGRAFSAIDEGDQLTKWGEYGCQIGDFLLFGDERLLRRIQEACR